MLKENYSKKKRIKQDFCKYCGEKIINKSHHCSGKKAFNHGNKTIILNLDKLFVYDTEEDELVIELDLWKDLKKNYLINKNS